MEIDSMKKRYKSLFTRVFLGMMAWEELVTTMLQEYPTWPVPPAPTVNLAKPVRIVW